MQIKNLGKIGEHTEKLKTHSMKYSHNYKTCKTKVQVKKTFIWHQKYQFDTGIIFDTCVIYLQSEDKEIKGKTWNNELFCANDVSLESLGLSQFKVFFDTDVSLWSSCLSQFLM